MGAIGAGPQIPMGPEGGGIVRAPQPEQLHLGELVRDTTDPSKVNVTITGSGGTFIVTINAKKASEEKIKEFAKQLFYLAVAHNVSETKTISYKQATPDTQASLIVQRQGKADKSYQIDNLATHLQDRKGKLEHKKADAELLRNQDPNAPQPTLSRETPDEKIDKRKAKLDEAYTQKIEKVATALAFFTNTERRVNVQVEEETHEDPYPEVPPAQLKQTLMFQGFDLEAHPHFDALIERSKNLSKDTLFTQEEKQELLSIYEAHPQEFYKINIISALLSHALKNEQPKKFNDDEVALITSAVKQTYHAEELSPEQINLLREFLDYAPNSPSEDVRKIAYDLNAAGF